MKPVKLGLLGVGTVGASTAMVLKNNAAEIARRAGRRIEIIQASRRSVGSGMPRGCDNIDLVSDPFEVVNNPEVDIVIELIGGYEPALELVMQSIANGKHVVTANKALIALHGNEIFAEAQSRGVNVVFEAAVLGLIPFALHPVARALCPAPVPLAAVAVGVDIKCRIIRGRRVVCRFRVIEPREALAALPPALSAPFLF